VKVALDMSLSSQTTSPQEKRIYELEKELIRLRNMFYDWSNGNSDDEWFLEAETLTSVIGD
tara:strand:+ start:68 stop:250 length:183 start_codon:yes stop_codon:yes gene_type:complete